MGVIHYIIHIAWDYTVMGLVSCYDITSYSVESNELWGIHNIQYSLFNHIWCIIH